MLKSWSIENFKPIVNSGELNLAPVTVLAGLNSSGKSSLLQSILMISQTLSSRVLDRALLPNGPSVQLGTLEDILNTNNPGHSLTVGFKLEMEAEELKSLPRRRVTEGGIRPSYTDLNSINFAKVIAKFSSTSGNGKSASAIEAASKVIAESIEIEINTKFSTPLEVSTQPQLFDNSDLFLIEDRAYNFVIRKMTEGDYNEFIQKVNPEYLRLIPYPTDQTKYLGDFHVTSEDNKGPYLVGLSHFLPTRLLQKFREETRRKQLISHGIMRLFDYPGDVTQTSVLPSVTRSLSEYFDLTAPIPENLRESASELYRKKDFQEEIPEDLSLLGLIRWFKTLKPQRKRTAITREFVQLTIDHIMQDISKQEPEVSRDSEGLHSVVGGIYIESLLQAIEQINRFFTSKIRYLGPLRADPQHAQGFPPSSELDDVGQKGDYAAFIYEANQNAMIHWFNPNNKEVVQGTLKAALDSWARYLQVAHQIKTETGGQGGVRWEVANRPGQRFLPLTAVGVGLSQILPILVMGLLAPSNTLLIVEQPELHLHPRVQARLGDFFLGLAKCKKQCLIETHSENLVNQLRYHIVQSGGQEKSDCLIYFVCQDEGGASRFEPVEISPEGNILNWPEGFFDETMHQEDRITAESLKKRASLIKDE